MLERDIKKWASILGGLPFLQLLVGVSSVQVLVLLPADFLSVVLNLHGAGQGTNNCNYSCRENSNLYNNNNNKNKGIMTGVFILSFLLPLVTVGDLRNFLLVKLGIEPNGVVLIQVAQLIQANRLCIHSKPTCSAGINLAIRLSLESFANLH